MQNILRYLTPEILAWESGNIREVRPLGSVLCLPDGSGTPSALPGMRITAVSAC
mgnify:CR=1 FL=1